MSIETGENFDFIKNGDNKNSITTESGSCDVAGDTLKNPSIEERIVSKMFSCSRETICLILGVTFGFAFAALHSVPPRISKPPPAKPFFNQNSIIIDFYKGQLNAMIDRGSGSDLNFVMYYAPWDAESQSLRYEFERVAHYYHTKVLFSAINCWHPGSECRTQYSKIQSYPVLVLYPYRGSGIQYRGILSAPYIMRFLNGFLKPIHRISSQKDLKELLIDNDSVMVGFFDFKGSAVKPGYREFHKTAIRTLERDPNRDVIFAVVTSANIAATEFHIERTPSASLYLWNESLIYPVEKTWTSENLFQWLDRSVHKVSLWLQPPGIKSSTIAPYLQDGPILLMFTPRNPLHPSNYNHDLLREVALEYHSCNDDILTGGLSKLLRIKNANAMVQHYEKSKRCLELIADYMIQPPPIHVSISAQQWINDSCCAQIYINKCSICERDDTMADDVCDITSNTLNKFCSRNDVFKILYHKEPVEHHFCCYKYSSRDSRNIREEFSSSIITEDDPRSPLAVRLRHIQDDCIIFLAGNKYQHPIFPDLFRSDATEKLEKLACDMNRTMAFISVDSLNYFHFAEGLGIDVLQMRDKTAVVIVDSLQESQYSLTENLSRDSLVKFINNYSNGSLSRKLRSNAMKQVARDSKTDSTCKNKKPSEVCIEELNTETFLNTILDPTKDVVVMYHSPYCAFCSAISHVYLTVANLLSKVNRIAFVRIDGDNNDLPWEYSMNRYPSILFFPAKRKADSTIFPSSLPITVPNLINYILANLESDINIEALVNICYKSTNQSGESCVAKIRGLCLEVIDKYLQSYRKLLRLKNTLKKTDINLVNEQRKILMKLEHIREIHLILSLTENLNRNSDKYQQLLEKFHDYYWNSILIKNRTMGVFNREMTASKSRRKINDEL